MITIDLLKNHPQALPRLANIWHEVLGKIWMLDISVERFSDHLNDEKLPLSLIALDGDMPVGMCSLRENDGIRPEIIYNSLSPEALAKVGWLGSLVVDPKYQKQGVGKVLIEATKAKAKSMNFDKLYLFVFDPHLSEYYKRFGWHLVGVDEFEGYTVTVMEVNL